MRRNGYLWTSGVNLDTAVWFADPDFPLECKISAIRRRFTLIFAFNILFVWPTDLESIPLVSTPTSIIPTKFEVDMTIHCRVLAFLSADTSRDFVTLNFDLLILNSCCAWRVTWLTLLPRLKTLRPSVLDLWADRRRVFKRGSKVNHVTRHAQQLFEWGVKLYSNFNFLIYES